MLGETALHTGEFIIITSIIAPLYQWWDTWLHISILCLLTRLVLWLQEQVSYRMCNYIILAWWPVNESSKVLAMGGIPKMYIYVNIYICTCVYNSIFQHCNRKFETHIAPKYWDRLQLSSNWNLHERGLSSFSRTWPELISPTLNLPDGVPHSGRAVANSILSLFLLRIIKANMNPLDFIYRWWVIRVFQHAI